eukprot:5339283-Ditylum_brightwellii.AAC.1
MKTGGTNSSGSSSRSTADHGSTVPMLAESNLKLACYNLKKQEKYYRKPKKGYYSTIKKKNWPNAFLTAAAVCSEVDNHESNFDTPAD